MNDLTVDYNAQYNMVVFKGNISLKPIEETTVLLFGSPCKINFLGFKKELVCSQGKCVMLKTRFSVDYPKMKSERTMILEYSEFKEKSVRSLRDVNKEEFNINPKEVFTIHISSDTSCVIYVRGTFLVNYNNIEMSSEDLLNYTQSTFSNEKEV